VKLLGLTTNQLQAFLTPSYGRDLKTFEKLSSDCSSRSMRQQATFHFGAILRQLLDEGQSWCSFTDERGSVNLIRHRYFSEIIPNTHEKSNFADRDCQITNSLQAVARKCLQDNQSEQLELSRIRGSLQDLLGQQTLFETYLELMDEFIKGSKSIPNPSENELISLSKLKIASSTSLLEVKCVLAN